MTVREVFVLVAASAWTAGVFALVEHKRTHPDRPVPAVTVRDDPGGVRFDETLSTARAQHQTDARCGVSYVGRDGRCAVTAAADGSYDVTVANVDDRRTATARVPRVPPIEDRIASARAACLAALSNNK